MTTIATDEPTAETVLSKEESEQLGSALFKCEGLLETMGLPTMLESFTSHINCFCEGEGCDDDFLDPFEATSMKDVIDMAINDNAKYRQIVADTWTDNDRQDPSDTPNRMEATISLYVLMEKLKPVYDKLSAPDKSSAKKRKVDN